MPPKILRSPFTWTIALGVIACVAAALVPRALASTAEWYSVPGNPWGGKVTCYNGDRFTRCDIDPYFSADGQTWSRVGTQGYTTRTFNNTRWQYTPDNVYPGIWTYGWVGYRNSAGTWVSQNNCNSPSDAYTAFCHLGGKYSENVRAYCGIKARASHGNRFSCETTRP